MAKWIAVINRIEARIFDAEDMRLIHSLTNKLGRQKNRALTRAKPGIGRNRQASKSSIHNLTGEKNPHDDVAIQFSRKLNLFLSRRFSENFFDELLIVAEPRMMGWLKESMNKNLRRHCEWKRKDLGKASNHELRILFLGEEAVWPKAVSQRSNF